MTYFLIVYDRSLGKLIAPVEEFTQAQRIEAMDHRFALEREHRDHPNIEIVVLGAESMDVIMKTHGRYFKTLKELGDMLVAEAAV